MWSLGSPRSFFDFCIPAIFLGKRKFLRFSVGQYIPGKQKNENATRLPDSAETSGPFELSAEKVELWKPFGNRNNFFCCFLVSPACRHSTVYYLSLWHEHNLCTYAFLRTYGFVCLCVCVCVYVWRKTCGPVHCFYTSTVEIECNCCCVGRDSGLQQGWSTVNLQVFTDNIA